MADEAELWKKHYFLYPARRAGLGWPCGIRKLLGKFWNAPSAAAWF